MEAQGFGDLRFTHSSIHSTSPFPPCHDQHWYSSSIFNVSGMSYGALSDNAVLALNTAARMGGFSHNTGEGGISRFHLAPGGASAIHRLSD